MLFTKRKLKIIDEYLYFALLKSIDIMPNRLIKVIAYYYPDARVRKEYLKKMGFYMGENTYANLGLKLAIDEFSSNEKITIGKNVSIAPNVTFIADSCANNGVEINNIDYVKEKLTKKGKIIIEDEVWIGANVTILPNVKIGRCSIIGAGSLVVKDVDPYSIVIGSPARKIKCLK